MGLFGKDKKEKEKEQEEKNPKDFRQFARQYMRSADNVRVACCRTCGKPMADCKGHN